MPLQLDASIIGCLYNWMLYNWMPLQLAHPDLDFVLRHYELQQLDVAISMGEIDSELHDWDNKALTL